MRRILSVAAVSAVLACSAGCGTPVDTSSEGSKVGFALSFFRNVNSVFPQDENLIVSPYSAGVALSMLEVGAGGETRVELDNALNGTIFREEELGEDGKMVAESSNAVWISDDFSIRNRYVGDLEKYFDVFVDNIDFAGPSAVKEINNWCSEHTSGKITEIVDRLSPDVVMVLVNALYFNAPWADAFNPDLTHEDVFHGTDGDVTLPMMYRKGMYEYAEYKGFQVVGIPYADDGYSMYIVLPPADMDINSAVPYLGEGVYDAAVKMLSGKEVSLTMPKFRLTSSLVLNEGLEKMGIRSAFSPAADFGGISASGRLVLDVVKQKCYIDVSERGTEAAAVTSAQIRMTSVRPETIMNVDRPFLFMIADREKGNILFIGKILNL